MLDEIFSTHLLFLIIAAFVMVLILVPVLKPLALKLGLVDHPDARKQHVGQIPLIGGLVAFPCFMICDFLSGAPLEKMWPLYAGITVLLITGAVDDRFHIRPYIKFGMQFLAAFLVVIFGGIQLHSLGDLFGYGEFELGFMALPFSIVSVVLLINAINLMDGLDGLAGGVGFIIIGWLVAAELMSGFSVGGASALIMMAALLGFLFYNKRAPWRKKAVIFMGDAGSMSLGLVIAWFSISFASVDGVHVEAMAVAWVLAIPIWDECAQFYRRVCEGRHPFSPDRGHLHHHFIQAGLSDGRAVLLIYALVFIAGGFGVLWAASGLGLLALTSIWIVGILAHMALSKNLERYPKILNKIGLGDKA